ncbi:MAG: 5'-nucleotidase C-terminal domain-containing protein [Labilibaculum antarcticum]
MDVCFQNTGGIHSCLNGGDISKKEIYEISPFNNGTVIYEITVFNSKKKSKREWLRILVFRFNRWIKILK